MLRPPPRPTLFPYTTLFRSVLCVSGALLRFGAHNAATGGAPLGTWTLPNTVQTNSISAASLQTPGQTARSEEHTSELQSLRHLVCRLLLEKKKQTQNKYTHD